jgi:hypothetical protein
MAALSNYLENMLVDGILRGAAVNAAGTVNSTAVVAGVWAGTTAYTLGQVVAPPSTFTAGGGKFLQCTTTLACPAIGSTLTDGTVTWTAVSGIPAPAQIYCALFSISNGLRSNSTAYVSGNVISLTANGAAGGDTKQHLYRCTTSGTTASSQAGYGGVPNEVITDGTAVFTEMSSILALGSGFPSGFAEISGGSYARVAIAPTLANFAGTQSAGSTTSSTGTSGLTSNNAPVTFPAPTAAWANGTAAVGAIALYTLAASGNVIIAAPLTVPKSVNNADASPSFSISSLQWLVDNGA